MGSPLGPNGAARAFLAVYLTTLRAHSDKSCIILPGEHPFIQHETVAAYNAVQRWTGEKLEELMRAGTAKLRQPVSPALLERLRQGMFLLTQDAARHRLHGARRVRRFAVDAA